MFLFFVKKMQITEAFGAGPLSTIHRLQYIIFTFPTNLAKYNGYFKFCEPAEVTRILLSTREVRTRVTSASSQNFEYPFYFARFVGNVKMIY